MPMRITPSGSSLIANEGWIMISGKTDRFPSLLGEEKGRNVELGLLQATEVINPHKTAKSRIS